MKDALAKLIIVFDHGLTDRPVRDLLDLFIQLGESLLADISFIERAAMMTPTTIVQISFIDLVWTLL